MTGLVLLACGAIPVVTIAVPALIYDRIQRRRMYQRDVEHYNRWVQQMEGIMRRNEDLGLAPKSRRGQWR